MDETAVQDGAHADATALVRSGRAGGDPNGMGFSPTSSPPWFALPHAGDAPLPGRSMADNPVLPNPVQATAPSPSQRSSGIGEAASLPDTDLIRLALHKILSSPEFASADQLRAFLRYVVEATCQQPPVTLKGYTIATEALGRGYDFNPTTDPIVRVEAARLRKRLLDYYAGSGREDPIRIEIPKGSYVPLFILQRRTALPEEPQMAEPPTVPAAPLAPSEPPMLAEPALPPSPPAPVQPMEPVGLARPFFGRPELVGLVAVVAFVAGLVIGGI